MFHTPEIVKLVKLDEQYIQIMIKDWCYVYILISNIWQLEARLAEKEEQMLEKDLIFEQVNRLVDRVKNKAEGGKEDTLELAKKVCEITSPT